ncbi:MAG: monomethylamine:corrinoid methyltransferase [Deltaproteobacteria bacterium]|nr:monomethylamine:corrinoid methyltransferase [Deltaproteobacteria bacterium]
MIDFWEVVNRSDNGEMLAEGEFDRRVGRVAREVTKKYDIKYNPEVVIPSDDSLPDRLFDAAVEFFLEVGVYCTDTGRVMKFDKKELFDALEAGVNQIVWGEGRDQRVQRNRKVEDSRPPFCNFTLVGTPYSEETFLQAAMSAAKEPLADCFSAGSLLHTLGGIEVRSGSPIEVEAAIWDLGKRREAARRVGHPGKGMYTMVSAAEKADAMIAAARPEFGALARDGVLCGAIAEMKVDYDRMKKVPFLRRTTYTIGGLYGPLMGGYAGGPEGTSMVLVAHHFLGRLVFETEYSCCFPIEIHETCNTTRRMLWLVSTAHQALARNTHLLHFANTFIAAGPCTEMACYELIAHGITAAVSGSDLSPAAVARNRHPERCTGMEGRICAEAAHSATRMGLSRKDANDLVKKILPKYEDKISEAPVGKTISECYDMERVEPNQEYLDLYERIKKEVSSMGLVYPSMDRV